MDEYDGYMMAREALHGVEEPELLCHAISDHVCPAAGYYNRIGKMAFRA